MARSNLGPECVYLVNALNFAMFKTVGHYDHPGTPLQLLGAIIIKTGYL